MIRGLITSCEELPSKARYWREYKGNDRNDGKTKENKEAAAGWT